MEITYTLMSTPLPEWVYIASIAAFVLLALFILWIILMLVYEMPLILVLVPVLCVCVMQVFCIVNTQPEAESALQDRQETAADICETYGLDADQYSKNIQEALEQEGGTTIVLGSIDGDDQTYVCEVMPREKKGNEVSACVVIKEWNSDTMSAGQSKESA